jgi:ArsR family transcriptional regulator
MHITTSRRRLAVHPTEACCADGGGSSAAVAPPSLDPERVDELAGRLKALADPTRLRILDLLAQQAEPTWATQELPQASLLCVCDITAHFQQNQPTISHHLRLLREARLVDCERRGVWAFYWATVAGREMLARVKRLS